MKATPYTARDCFNCEFAWGIECAKRRQETSWEFEDRGWHLAHETSPRFWRYILGFEQPVRMTDFGKQVVGYLKSLGYGVEVSARIIQFGLPLLIVIRVWWKESK